ncbi:MAG: hypothetical protein ABII75_01455 [Candidatus Omnitrophota bacterium]
MKSTIDMLKEVGMSAADKAGAALSLFFDNKVILKPSFVEVISIQDIHKNLHLKSINVGILIFARLVESLQGELFFSLDEKCAYRLINLSKMAEIVEAEEKFGEITEMGMSVLKEAGNIVIGSYLIALGEIIKKAIPQPVPMLLGGPFEEIFSKLVYYPYIPVKHIQRYLIQTEFDIPKIAVTGTISLSLHFDSVEDMKRHLQKN